MRSLAGILLKIGAYRCPWKCRNVDICGKNYKVVGVKHGYGFSNGSSRHGLAERAVVWVKVIVTFGLIISYFLMILYSVWKGIPAGTSQFEAAADCIFVDFSTLLLKWRAERIDSWSRHTKHYPTYSVYITQYYLILELTHSIFLLNWRGLPYFGTFYLAILLVKLKQLLLRMHSWA